MDFFTIFFLNPCIFRPQKLFPSYSGVNDSSNFWYFIWNFLWYFFWISAFFDHKSSFPHIADEFTSVIFRINKGLSADFFLEFLHFLSTLTPWHTLPTRPPQRSDLTRYSGLQSIWQLVQGTLYTSPNKYLWSVSNRIRALEAYSSIRS